MKAMFLSDYLTIKKPLITTLLLGFAVGIFIGIVTKNAFIVVPLLCTFTVFSVGFNMMALDELNKWEQFRLALPLSRASTVCGRYLSLAAVTVAGAVLGLVVVVVTLAAASLLPTIPQLVGFKSSFSWQFLWLAGAAGVAFSLVLFAVVLPFVARTGLTKAVRFLPIVLILVFVLGATFIDSEAVPQFLYTFLAWLETPEGMLITIAVVLAGALVLYGLSCAISVKIYQKREF